MRNIVLNPIDNTPFSDHTCMLRGNSSHRCVTAEMIGPVARYISIIFCRFMSLWLNILILGFPNLTYTTLTRLMTCLSICHLMTLSEAMIFCISKAAGPQAKVSDELLGATMNHHLHFMKVIRSAASGC